MKILFKYPTRQRLDWFKETMQLWLSKLSAENQCTFLVAMDTDDKTMNNDEVRRYMEKLPFVEYFYKNHNCKIEAYNSGLNDRDFEIVMPVSEDLEPQENGYDAIIVKDMLAAFPGLDGVIYYNDGRCGKRVVTFPIMGVNIYKSLGYLCNPIYKAWSDKDLTYTLRKMGRLKYINRVLFKHFWGKQRYDQTYLRARVHRGADARVWKQRFNEEFARK